MLTYPSTHGVFEVEVQEICAAVHDAGGQVYVDGANLNALVGLAKPGRFGSDVSHLNLHKTFCIPHGGGGPGVGPIGVREHLVPFLPEPPAGRDRRPGPGRLRRALGFGRHPADLLGLRPADGPRRPAGGHRARDPRPPTTSPPGCGSTTRCSTPAPTGLVAHECILDIRPLTKATGVTNDDIAKRLIDFGFHAPTMSFPVAGTLMVEPTESEDKAELDRFVEAMVAIRGGDREGRLRGVRPRRQPAAQRTAHAGDAGGGVGPPLPPDDGGLPGEASSGRQYLSPVRRIDQAYGDRNLVCSCPPPEAFAEHDFGTRRRRPGTERTPAGPPAHPTTSGRRPTWWAPGHEQGDVDAKADLQRYLQTARDALVWKLEGLSEYDVRRPMTAHRHEPAGPGQAPGLRGGRLLRRHVRPSRSGVPGVDRGRGRGAELGHVGDGRGVTRRDPRPVPAGLGTRGRDRHRAAAGRSRAGPVVGRGARRR